MRKPSVPRYTVPSMAILYQNSPLYHALMALAYRGNRHERFKAVARWIPDHSQVLDVCCGDGSLIEYLSPSVNYKGFDQSRPFVTAGRKKGRQIEYFDLTRQPLTPAQIVVCQVSLFQFYPNVEDVLASLFEAAKWRLIISESVLSLTQSRWSWVANIVAWGTDPNGMSNNRFRFNATSLEQLFSPYKEYIIDSREVCAGRDWVYVLDK